jgi:CubicO group peptidase (beta-lactamase class C family)
MVATRTAVPFSIAAAIYLVVSPAPIAQVRSTVDLSPAARAAGELPQLHSLLVSVRGELVFEHYAPKIKVGGLANIKSASKSIVSTLIGIAISKRMIGSISDPAAKYLPALARATADKRAITIEDLLTMRSGLESTSGENYGRWVSSRNWVQHAVDKPLISKPGTSMEYSTGTSHLLSAIITRVSKTSTWQFAQTNLAKPLGITLARWTRDPQGIFLGGNEMLMTPRQMVEYGELYLNRGRVGKRQVVPAQWVAESCRPRTRSRWDSSREYGYGWWIQDIGAHRSCFAWGYGGQYVFTFPELEAVVVVTSTTASEERHGYRRRLFEVIADHVLGPLATASTH